MSVRRSKKIAGILAVIFGISCLFVAALYVNVPYAPAPVALFKGSGPLETCLVSDDWHAVVSDGNRCGLLYLSDPTEIPSIFQLPVKPRAVWGWYRDSNGMTFLSTGNGRTLQTLGGNGFQAVKSYSLMHGGSLQGAVADAARRRFITIGTDGPPSISSFHEPDGYGDLSVWDFNGSPIQSRYHFHSEPRLIVADQFVDNIAVGTRDGFVHLFKSGSGGLEPTIHVRLESPALTTLAMSKSGQFVVAAGNSGSRLWKTGNFTPVFQVQYQSPGEWQDSVNASWTFLDGRAGTADRAVSVRENHLQILSLQNDIGVVSEFDLDLSYVKAIAPAHTPDHLILLGIPKEKKRGDKDLYTVYLLDLRDKKMSELKWGPVKKSTEGSAE